MPLAAGTLQGIRGGDLTLIASQIAVFFSYPVILYQANSIPIMNAVGTENFFWGEEYYTGLVKFIPRFLWPDKPLSFDYKLKELANYDFEGGGIYTTLCNDLYINFGYYYFIFYILWLLFIHYLYRMVMDDKRFYYSRIIALFIILMGGIASTIGSCEILLLFPKVSHPLKHQLFSFSFVCLPPYPLTVNTCLTEVMQTIHILRPIFPTLQPLQGFCSSLCRFR